MENQELRRTPVIVRRLKEVLVAVGEGAELLDPIEVGAPDRAGGAVAFELCHQPAQTLTHFRGVFIRAAFVQIALDLDRDGESGGQRGHGLLGPALRRSGDAGGLGPAFVDEQLRELQGLFGPSQTEPRIESSRGVFFGMAKKNEMHTGIVGSPDGRGQKELESQPPNSYFVRMTSTRHRVHRYVSNDFTLRASAVNATEVVREMQKLQTMAPLPTVAVGRAMTGAILMASHLKEGQQVGLYFRGTGPLSSIYAEANHDGQVRAYTPHALYEPAEYKTDLSLKEHVGVGTLIVTRHQPFQKQPFQGMVEMVSGEIGDDIAYYLQQSQQIRSLVSVGVYLDAFGQVRAAGGLMIEVMPGVEEEIVEKVQKNAEKLTLNVSKAIFDGAHPGDLVRPYLEGIPYTELDHDYPLEYSCPCDKDRVIRALETLGLEELQDMVSKSEEAEVVCQICGRPYKIPVSDIEELRNRLYKNSLN